MAPIEKQDASELVEHDAVARILAHDALERRDRRRVVAVGLLDQGLEIVDAPERVVARQRLADEGLGRVGLTFLDERARHVQPAVGILRFRLRHLREGVLRAFQVALQQQPDAPVVPALAALLVDDGLPHGRRRAVAHLQRASSPSPA